MTDKTQPAVELPEAVAALREAILDWGFNMRNEAMSDLLEHADRIAALAHAAATPADAGGVDAKYEELLYAVGNKYPGESRHETALRYIRQAETQDHAPAAATTKDAP